MLTKSGKSSEHRLLPTFLKTVDKPNPRYQGGKWENIDFNFSFFYHFAPIYLNSNRIIIQKQGLCRAK